MKGTVQIRQVDSKALTDNPLGDPSRRAIPVYLPPGYPAKEQRYPVIYFLHGFMGSSLGWLNVSPFTPTVLERLDALIANEDIPPVLGVFADGWTSLGGSQWLNSEATGRYQDYVANDLISYVDREFQSVTGPGGRAIVGKSSGGYGAWAMACSYPERFGHLAAHSADAYFEYCYLPEFPKAAAGLLLSGGPEKWFAEFRKRARETKMRNEDFPVLNIIAMAAAYSPKRGEQLNIELPFDPVTARLRPSVWEEWLRRDPVRFVAQAITSLRKMQSIFIDCGTRDEFHLRWGARMLANELRSASVDHVHEEFEDGHMGINYRYDRSLLYLAPRLATR